MGSIEQLEVNDVVLNSVLGQRLPEGLETPKSLECAVML